MFKEEIERTIGKVLRQNSFKMIINSENNIFFIKRYSNKLGYYIRCIDRRNDRNGIVIEMYFTVIQKPDDRVSDLDIGLKIEILTIYFNITDEILVSAGEKILAIEKNIGNMSEIIVGELKNTYFINEATLAIIESIEIYNTLEKNEKIQEDMMNLKSGVCRAIRNKENEKVFMIINEYIDNLPIDFLKVKQVCFDKDKVKQYLGEQIYAQCMLDA